jgi:heme-degrading monooxygenase HmoA
MREDVVAPVAAHEPPYYAVVFASVRPVRAEDDGYAETGARLGELVREIPGFLGEDAARGGDGFGISVAYFKTLAGIQQWRADAEHVAAKRRGREEWFERYTIHIAKVEHSHGFERATADPDPAFPGES